MLYFFIVEVEAKGQTDKLSNKEIQKLLTMPALTAVTGMPSKGDCVRLWIEEKTLESIELDDGDEVRVKTHGNGPFIGKFLLIFS